MFVYLNDNRLNTIANDSFFDIKDAIVFLDLRNNILTTLPQALGQLSQLNTLKLQGNNVVHLDVFTMVNIGHTLLQLEISFGNITSWPVEFKYLRGLHQLTIAEVPLQFFPDNAFHGFEQSLSELIIVNSTEQKIPSAICHLRNLDRLSILNNKYLEEKQTPVVQPCVGNKTQVRNLFLVLNYFEQFPNLHDMFSSIVNMVLVGNMLHVMNPNTVQVIDMIQTIDFQSNLFVRIPAALNLYSSLRILILNDNLIQSVEDLDLYKLEKLEILSLDNNPLEYITNDAFKNNQLLNYISLSGTKLIRIPSALKQLPSLNYVYLESLQIECTCDMVDLKTWNVSQINFSKNSMCFMSNEELKDYIVNTLPSCL